MAKSNLNQSVIQWNIRGLRANYEELVLLLNEQNPSVLALQETLIPKGKDFSLSGFTVISDNIDRGVALCIKNSILSTPLKLNTPLEAVAAKLSLGNKTMSVCCLYLTPSRPVNKQHLTSLIEQLPQPFLLLGDFNGHSPTWGSDSLDLRGKIIEDVINSANLSILNSGSPTYCSPANGTLSHIDLSICDPSLFLDLEWSVHDDLCGSDHYPVILKFIESCSEEYLGFWKLKHVNWEQFNVTISHRFQEETNNILQSPDAIQAFTDVLISATESVVPKTKASNQPIRKPWFDKQCEDLKNERKAAHRVFYKYPTAQNKRKHQTLRNKCRSLFKAKRKTSWKKFCSTLTSKTQSTKIWKAVRKIKGRFKPKQAVQCLKQNGVTISDKKQVANLLAETIAQNSASENYDPTFQKIKQAEEKHPITFSSDQNSDYNIPFTLEELKESLTKASDSAVGPDEVHYQFLRHLDEDTLKLLLQILNNIWSTGKFPPSWREATVIPIPKPGKDHSDPNNYRPIALTSCLCKTMERMVHTRLMWFLESNGLLANTQCGFRKNRCTTDHLIRFESFIRNAFVQGERVVAILFDLEKAYDTTWKHGILKDLKEMGLDGQLPTFIGNFLSERIFRVRIGSCFSDPFEQDMGVPQGSILSPLLFNIKINNIVKTVRQGMQNSLFVDDFALMAKGKHLHSIERQLQLCVNAIEKWALENGFKFSQTKTECIHFSQRRERLADPVITLKGSPIKVSNQVKFLGLIFDSRLSFVPHIKYLRTSCMQTCNLLKVISSTDWGADKKTLLMLYRSLIRAKLDYGCVVYGTAKPSHLKALNPVVHQALRICLGAFRTSPVESLYVEANEPPLELRRKKLEMNYFLKIKTLPENPAYEEISSPHNATKFEEKKLTPTFGTRVRKHLAEAGINPDLLNDDELSTTLPPWKLNHLNIDTSLSKLQKNCTNPSLFKLHLNEKLENYSNYDQIYTDGSKAEEKVAAAAVAKKGKKIHQCRLPDNSSVFTAELRAILLALKEIYQSQNSSFLILSDSLSALEALSSLKMTHPLLVEIYELHETLLSEGKTIVFIWVPSHIGIRGNEMADSAAKDALSQDIPRYPVQSVPYKDFKPKVNSYIHNLWQTRWDEETHNKLHSARPNLSDALQTFCRNRKEETTLSRLHIGHTYATHSHLVNGKDPPWCHACDQPWTVKHFLLECADLLETRLKYYDCSSLKDLFTTVSISSICGYLQEINLLHKV